MYKFLFSLVLFSVPFVSLAVDYGFGGSYCPTSASSCLGIGAWTNVHTGAYSCPSGYTDTTINSSFHECWNTITVGATSLSDLSDVTITSAVSGQVLMKGSGDWVNYATSTGSGGTTINNFSSTTLLSIATGTSLAISSEPINMANGMLLFMIAFWGIIWFFRRNR